MTATLVIFNARVLTMDPDRPEAGAVALSGDRIAALGDEPLAMAGPECRR